MKIILRFCSILLKSISGLLIISFTLILVGCNTNSLNQEEYKTIEEISSISDKYADSVEEVSMHSVVDSDRSESDVELEDDNKDDCIDLIPIPKNYKETQYISGDVYGFPIREFIYCDDMLIELNEYSSERVLQSKCTYEYDDNNRLIRENLSDETSLYEYDEHGNVITKTDYWSSGEMYFRTIYEYQYDDNGRKMQEIARYQHSEFEKPSDNYSLTIFDNDEKRIENSICNSDGSLFFRTHYDYNQKGEKTKTTRFDSNNECSTWETYEYDVNNQLIKETSFDSDGSIMSWCEYEYDENKNLIKEIHNDGGKGFTYQVDYEYEYFE